MIRKIIRKQKILFLLSVLTLVLLFPVFALALALASPKLSPIAPTPLKSLLLERGVVASVVDGDTIHVRVGKKILKVRLLGIDAPEMTASRKENKCLAQEAKKYLEKLVKKQLVILKSDPQGDRQDKYKRALRYVYLKDGTMINVELVKNGLVRAETFFPFQAKEEFKNFENQAKGAGLNMWGKSRCFKKS